MASSDRPGHGLQVFSAPANAVRVRRINDLVSVVFGAGVLLVLAVVASSSSELDGNWSGLAADLPGWLLWAAQATYVVSVGNAAALILGVGAFARGRLELIRDLLLAAALAGAMTIGLSHLVDARLPEVLLAGSAPATTFPALFVAVTAAIQAAAGPHLSAPFRRWGWAAVLAGAAGSLVGNLAQPSDVVAALLVGSLAAGLVRLGLGTSAGLPSPARVAGGLADLGLEVVGLGCPADQPVGSAVFTGTSVGGAPVWVRVLGRDAWEARRWSQWWRFALYQDDGPQRGHSRREAVEHEALALLLAHRAGVRVPKLLVVGTSAQDDALLAVESEGELLGDLEPSRIGATLLAGIWEQVVALHAGGLSHGQLSSSSIAVAADGTPTLTDFASASLSATAQQQDEDIVELMISLALVIGTDRAVASAIAALGEDRLGAALPVMQPAAVSPSLRIRARLQSFKIGALRSSTAATLGVEPPPLEKIKRVEPTKVLMALAMAFAAYTIISGLADVGFGTIAEAVSTASLPLVLLALVVTQATNATDAMSLVAISPKPVPVGPATMEQMAISFVNMAMPTAAGQISVNIRFFQKFGISGVTSTSTSMIASFISLVGQLALLALTIVVGKRSIDLSALSLGDGTVKIVGLVVACLAVGGLVILVTPSLRRSLLVKVRDPFLQFREALVTVKQPKRLVRSLAASLATNFLYAAGLILCVRALGSSLELGQSLFIGLSVARLAGLSPAPGGIGVAEAGFVAGLKAVGIPTETAVAASLLYRLITYYVPPVWGWVCLRWLTRHDYL